jgi:hypothetical protein
VRDPRTCRTPPHGEFRDEIQTLFNEIIDAFPTDQAVPEARAVRAWTSHL